MSIFGSKNPILIKCPKSYFAVWILILVEDGSIKRWKYSNSSHKKAEFYSLQNRESQGPFWRITQQQQRILWCNRGAVVNFWRLFLRIEERTQKKLAKMTWSNICHASSKYFSKWNGIPRKYGSVRRTSKLPPIIIKKLDL